ncbi:uncharacterized protein [Aegilops tauschii subsp. strangulata]|uniref:non-specific serine/threonine protein kinase n=2 Tax=Aegilops tauschii subsp. strangulata TaxID=200361 RepID=A0A453A438_AEGTS|nr:putative disease resistance protein RGA3 isoform X3 [Aegilops tauschii subsp. strangulata]
MNIPYLLFKKVTKNFSEDRIIGRGGFGKVYKGELDSGELIAVKMLHPLQGLDEDLFKNEVCNNLLKVDHPNVIGLLGYCDELHSEFVEHKGDNIAAKHVYRGLCFEYFPNGSLHKHLSEQSLSANWSTRYSIIKGICEGLNFLHGCKPRIFHLDLKPANILLDNSMVPKLADFGLSRLFAESHSHVTERMIGTDKYMPPEYRTDSTISSLYDVFSFGVVMMDIMEGYSLYQEIDDPTQFKEELAVVPLSMKIDLKNSLAETLKVMTAELDKITNPVANTEQVPNIREASSSVEEPFFINKTEDRETSSYLEEKLIIGRTAEKKEILSILSESSTNEMVILPIHGIGGIGKTTLAQLVFNDKQFHGHSRAWVYVSEKLDLYKIGNSIITQLSKKISNIANMQIIHNRLTELFADKSILIVLDDLWEKHPRKLDELKAMLRPGKGSKVIIVTTRHEEIARKICSTAKNVPYKLKILTDEMCWLIIKQKSDFENKSGKTQLEKIGRDIAVKCGGVALAAQSLGYMLGYMTYDEWKSVRDSHVWHLSSLEDPSLTTHEVLASLRLSYSHMHKFLQFCFSYCGIFPKGHIIVKHDLIHQWIALQFPGPSKTFDSMQLCEQYITQLLGMSFLQYSVTPLDYARQDKVGTFFTMHDLVHELARAMLANIVNENDNFAGRNCQYAIFADPSKQLKSFVGLPQEVIALLIPDHAKIELHDGAISPAKRLVIILDLSGCIIEELPDFIGQMKHLRYIHAPRIRYRIIPNWITELSKLNYLNLRYSEIEALPDSIGDLKGLMHLDLSGCARICQLPASFGELKKLVHLDLSHCCMSIPEDLSGFTKLQHLNLSVKNAQAAKPIRELPKVIGNLINLRYLNLSRCMHVMAPSEEEIDRLLGSISTLFNLEHLDMSENSQISSLPESIGNLKKLHTLDLLGCDDIERLPKSMAKMECLKVLNLNGPASSLEESALSQLNVASLPHFVVSRGEYHSNLFLLRHTNPNKELEISGLENVMSAEEAQCIDLVEKYRIEDLTFIWTDYTEMSVNHIDKEVLEKLVPPSSLRKLHIDGYRVASLPDWMMGVGHYLPNLCRIDLSDFPKCNNLPAFGQLPNLEWLGLCCMESMEKWNMTCSSGEDDANELMFPKLETVSIQDCPKLTIEQGPPRAVSWIISGSDNVLSSAWAECSSLTDASSSPYRLIDLKLEVDNCNLPLRQWRLLHHLPALHSLTTKCRIDLAASPEIIQQLSSLKSMSLGFFRWIGDKAEVPAWLFQLTSLENLVVMHGNLDGLNVQARQLKRLQSLRVHACRSMASQPQWLGELTSLRELHISQCEGIKSLPDSIRQLTKLECLNVYECPELSQWCKSDENMMKLPHIKDKQIKASPSAGGQVEDLVEIEETLSPEAAMNLDTANGSRTNNTADAANNIAATTDERAVIEGQLYGEDVMDDQGCVLCLGTFLKKLFSCWSFS